MPGDDRTRTGPEKASHLRRALLVGASALSLLAPTARADTVLEWNAIALRTTGSAPFNPPLETRSLAIVHAAVFDAVNSVTREFRPYLVQTSAPAGASLEAAAAGAAHRALVELHPARRSALDAALEDSLSRLPDGTSRSDGIAIGIAVADRVLALRAPDGAAEASTAPYSPRGGVGGWVPTPPAFRPALAPGWGSVAPFLLRSGDQFRPGPPPEPTSHRYAVDLAEIRDAGAAGSTSRSQAQTDLARLWVATAPQVWNPVARQVATARGLGPAQTARLLALLNLAGADAFIASWDATFEAIAEDVVEARVWGGVHWRTSSEMGKRVGEHIGRYAVRQFLRPSRERPGLEEAEGDGD